VAVAYYELVLPCLAPRGVSSLRQVLDLALLVLGFSGIVFLASLLIEDAGSLDPWWQTGRSAMPLGVALGVLVFMSPPFTAAHWRLSRRLPFAETRRRPLFRSARFNLSSAQKLRC
jgi:hypothetical protein